MRREKIWKIFFNLKNKDVYYGVGPWILFYLMRLLFYLVRKSCEPTAAENEDCEAKS